MLITNEIIYSQARLPAGFRQNFIEALALFSPVRPIVLQNFPVSSFPFLFE